MAECSVSMESSERLELSFLSQPRRISASLIAPDGEKIFQNSFEGFNCLEEWVIALKAVAAATKNARLAHSPPRTSFNGNSLASLGSPSISSNNQTAACTSSHRMSVKASRRRDNSTAISALHRDPAARQTACSRSGHASTSVFQSPGTSLESISGLLPSGSSSPEQSQTLMSANVAEGPQATGPLTDDCPTTSNPSAKLQRTQRLEARLQAINYAPISNKDDFNDTIRRLYNEPFSASPQVMNSTEHFAHVLGRLGNIASVQGIIYSLLSWLIFFWEEERLVHDEGQALPVAAKRVNEMMAEISNRRARTKDWASDGRKAAGMVFDSIATLSTAAQSFALLVLAGKCNVTPDGLLKTAHFPVLREHFRLRFAGIVESRQKEWEGLASDGYLVFDYKKFLGNRGVSQGRASLPSRSESVSDRDIPTHSVHSTSPLPDFSDPLLMDMYSTCGDQVNYETQPSSAMASTPNGSNAGMLVIDAQYLSCEELQDSGFFGLPDNLQGNMDFQLWPRDTVQDFSMFADEMNLL